MCYHSPMTTCLFAPGSHPRGITYLGYEESAFSAAHMLRKLKISPNRADQLLSLTNGRVADYIRHRHRMGIAVHGRIEYLKALVDEFPDYWTPDRLTRELDWDTITSHPFGLSSTAVDEWQQLGGLAFSSAS